MARTTFRQWLTKRQSEGGAVAELAAWALAAPAWKGKRSLASLAPAVSSHRPDLGEAWAGACARYAREVTHWVPKTAGPWQRVHVARPHGMEEISAASYIARALDGRDQYRPSDTSRLLRKRAGAQDYAVLVAVPFEGPEQTAEIWIWEGADQ